MLLQLPVSTIQSGPVNSLRGAAALTGIADAIVIDIGEPCIIFIHLPTCKILQTLIPCHIACHKRLSFTDCSTLLRTSLRE